MTVATDDRSPKNRKSCAEELREREPKGPDQFDAILNPTQTEGDDGRDPGEAPAAEEIPGFTDNDLAELESATERYAAARRAATAGGRDTLYE
jgi:hypothetical protein